MCIRDSTYSVFRRRQKGNLLLPERPASPLPYCPSLHFAISSIFPQFLPVKYSLCRHPFFCIFFIKSFSYDSLVLVEKQFYLGMIPLDRLISKAVILPDLSLCIFNGIEWLIWRIIFPQEQNNTLAITYPVYIPVSYTHLFFPKLTATPDLLSNVFSRIMRPVSYTHLDVYKRQTFTAVNSRMNWIFGKNKGKTMCCCSASPFPSTTYRPVCSDGI